MFKLWTDDEIKAAIRDIEEQLIPGIFSVSYAGGGFVQNVSPTEARGTLRDLYAELATRPGYKHLRDASGQGRMIYYKMRY